jgi:hypothetical protein
MIKILTKSAGESKLREERNAVFTAGSRLLATSHKKPAAFLNFAVFGV